MRPRVVVLVGLATAALAVAAAPASATPSAALHRSVSLSGVAATSAQDVWAVGAMDNTGYSAYPTALHYDGHRWTTTQMPREGDFAAVAAISPDDVWAVGSDWQNLSEPLAYHWDGTSWTQVTTPAQLDPYSDLNAITALSSDDIYAFGYTEQDSGSGQTFVLHWDGSSWTDAAGVVSELAYMSAVSPTDAWGVGAADGKPLVAHWDGTAWQRVKAPQRSGEYFPGIRAVSSDDVWAFGETNGGYQQPFLEHWDGTTWSVIRDHAAPARFMVLTGLDGTGASDAWLTGTGQVGAGPLLQHWNGSAWSNVDDPAQELGGATPGAVVAISPTDAWVVGFWIQNQGGVQFDRRLLLHWDGSAWTRIH
jgi:hypothetical protein